jgi:hypothetical protein
MNDAELINKITSRYNALKEKRREWLEQCKLITQFVIPTRGHYSDSIPTDPYKAEFNTKAFQYSDNLASVFSNWITSPTQKWLRFSLEDEDVMSWGPVRRWLTEAEDITARMLRNDIRFYPEVHNAYKDLINFGTNCTSVYRDVRQGNVGKPIYSSYQVGEWYADYDEFGDLSVVYREFWMNAYIAAKKYPDTCSKIVKDLARDNPFKPVKIIHITEPREVRDSSRIDKYNMPFASYWWEAGNTERILAEGGFDYMPYQITRWGSSNNSVYSTGLGWIALKEAKGLNLLEYSATYGVNKMVNPPVQVQEGIYNLNLGPGGITYVPPNTVQGDAVKNLQTLPSSIEGALKFIVDWREILREIFMNKLFIFLLENPNATATEILERKDEKLSLLSPVIERINTEMLIPAVNNISQILMQGGFYPEPPPDLVGRTIIPQFQGVLAQAQLQHSTAAIDRIFAVTLGVAQAKPEALDKLNVDAAIDAYSSIIGVPSDVIYDKDSVDKMRQARQEQIAAQMQQQQQAADLQNVKTAAEATKIASETENTEGLNG